MMREGDLGDILAKIDWEGGMCEVLEYGLMDLEDYDVPDDLKTAWAEMAELYSDFSGMADNVWELIDHYRGADK
jgi:hypothetical protein